MSDDIPIRTGRVRYAESYLYDDFNDVDFFIEDNDENTKKIILKLLQRAFSNEIQITQIFPLGGRGNVIDQHTQRDRSRKQVYIIDSDLHLLFEDQPFEEGLVTWTKYCIENYLYDENAIYDLLYDECVNESDYDHMCRMFDLTTWWNTQVNQLFRLFLEYAIEKQNTLGITTVKYGVHRLLQTNRYELDKTSISVRIMDIRAQIKHRITKVQYNTNRVDIIKNVNLRNIKKESYISGKDYILPLLFQKIKNYSRSNLSDNNYKYRLAKTCDVLEIKALIQQHL